MITCYTVIGELPDRNSFKSLAVFIFQRVSNEYSRNNHIAITYCLQATPQFDKRRMRLVNRETKRCIRTPCRTFDISEQAISEVCMRKKLEWAGQSVGRLLVLYECGRSKDGRVLWKCRCECGNECIVSSSHLKNQRIQSCGCLQRECKTIHGLSTKHMRLCNSIRKHFKWISDGRSGYQGWTIDTRYPNNAQGVANFCLDLIELQPKMSELYESDRSLDVDKDNGGKVFCPECIVFRKATENRGKKPNNLKLLDGTPFVEFCRKLGYKTRGNGRPTREYAMFSKYFVRHNGAGHPELLKKANELVALYSKCLKLLKLRDEVRQLAEQVAFS